MMKKFSSFLLIALATIFFASSAMAHEFILKPSKTNLAAGENFSVQAQAAHVFMISEEAEPVETVTLGLLQGDKENPITLAEDASVNALTGTAALPKEGPAMLVGHRLPQIWSDTTNGVLEGDRKALEAKGETVLKVGKYEKFAKTLLNPATDDALYKKNLGQELEIILLSNPADIKGEGELKIQTFLHGKPAKTSLGVTYDGYSKEEDTYLTETETDAEGLATVKITKPGLWMLRIAHTDELTGQDADKHNMRATYVFPIN